MKSSSDVVEKKKKRRNKKKGGKRNRRRLLWQKGDGRLCGSTSTTAIAITIIVIKTIIVIVIILILILIIIIIIIIDKAAATARRRLQRRLPRNVTHRSSRSVRYRLSISQRSIDGTWIDLPFFFFFFFFFLETTPTTDKKNARPFTPLAPLKILVIDISRYRSIKSPWRKRRSKEIRGEFDVLSLISVSHELIGSSIEIATWDHWRSKIDYRYRSISNVSVSTRVPQIHGWKVRKCCCERKWIKFYSLSIQECVICNI